MEARPPQVDVDFVGDHAPRRFRIGDVEHMFIGRARECDAAELAHRAVRSVAPGDPRGDDLPRRSIRHLERRRDVPGFLREAHELGVPLDRCAPVAKPVAHDPFVVVLTEDENVRIRGHLRARPHPTARAPSFGPAPRYSRPSRACRVRAPDRRCRGSRRSRACALARPTLSSAARARHAGQRSACAHRVDRVDWRASARWGRLRRSGRQHPWETLTATSAPNSLTPPKSARFLNVGGNATAAPSPRHAAVRDESETLAEKRCRRLPTTVPHMSHCRFTPTREYSRLRKEL